MWLYVSNFWKKNAGKIGELAIFIQILFFIICAKIFYSPKSIFTECPFQSGTATAESTTYVCIDKIYL